MKFKKSVLKIMVLGGIFLFFAPSFIWAFSPQDENINNFWGIKKLDISLIKNTFAESGGGESGYNYNQKNEIKTPKTPEVYKETKKIDNISYFKIELSNIEKLRIEKIYKGFIGKIDKKYKSNLDARIKVLKKLDIKINEKVIETSNLCGVGEDKNENSKCNKKLSTFLELQELNNETINYTNSVISNETLKSIKEELSIITAPIGTKYTIILENGKYSFKRENGTYGNIKFNTSQEVIDYINKNAVAQTNIVKDIPIKKQAPVTPIVKKAVTPPVKITPKIPIKPKAPDTTTTAS